MSPRKILTALATALLAAGALLVPAAPAAAHPASWYYTASKWPTNASVSYGLNAGFPTNETPARVYEAKSQWNAADTGSEPSFHWLLADGASYGSWDNPCTLATGTNTMVLFAVNLDVVSPDAAGYTRACSSGGVRTRVTVAIDTTRDWYWQTGVPPGYATDQSSVLAHEIGHAAGHQVHFPEAEPGLCASGWDSGRHTMCPAIYSGTYMMRDLASHDAHTFQGAY